MVPWIHHGIPPPGDYEMLYPPVLQRVLPWGNRHLVLKHSCPFACNSVPKGLWWTSRRKPRLNKKACAIASSPLGWCCWWIFPTGLEPLHVETNNGEESLSKKKLVKPLFRCSYVRLRHVNKMRSAQRNAHPCHGHSFSPHLHSSTDSKFTGHDRYIENKGQLSFCHSLWVFMSFTQKRFYLTR